MSRSVVRPSSSDESARCAPSKTGLPGCLQRLALVPRRYALPAIAAAATAAAATTATAAIAAATAPVATATTATAAVATATAALLALLGLVHTERPTVEGLAVHALDGLGRFIGAAHGHEREAAGATGLAIGHEVDVGDRAELLEGSAHAVGVRVERKVSNIQTSVHRLLKLAQ